MIAKVEKAWVADFGIEHKMAYRKQSRIPAASTRSNGLDAYYPSGKHNAMVDLFGSITELEFYRKNVFRSPE